MEIFPKEVVEVVAVIIKAAGPLLGVRAKCREVEMD